MKSSISVLFIWVCLVMGISAFVRHMDHVESDNGAQSADNLVKEIESLQVIYDINEGHLDSSQAGLAGELPAKHSILSQR